MEVDHLDKPRAGSSHRKLSMKMKRRLRREKKKARGTARVAVHYCSRAPTKRVDNEARAKGMSRAAYVDWKSRQPARPPRKPVMVYVKEPQAPSEDSWALLRKALVSYARSSALV